MEQRNYIRTIWGQIHAVVSKGKRPVESTGKSFTPTTVSGLSFVVLLISGFSRKSSAMCFFKFTQTWFVMSCFILITPVVLSFRRGSEDWHEMYGKCAGNEIYDIRLGASKMFRPFCKKRFSDTAFHVHRKYVIYFFTYYVRQMCTFSDFCNLWKTATQKLWQPLVHLQAPPKPILAQYPLLNEIK